MILLANLPTDHALRNTPLGELDARYRWKGSTGAWRTVKQGAPKLMNCTYNELGTSWTLFDDWSVEDE
jgi:hypothetical protein